ncbi:hypothetical protein Aperf_G00000002431 [Anoplocephala perfoliata]
MWCRDAQHRKPCSLCDIHLPPHSGRVRWLSDWEVDFSPLPGCASHHTPALLRQSHSDSRCEECDSEPRTPPISPSGSPRHGTTATETLSSSVGSLEFVATTNTTTVAPPPSPSALNSDFKNGGMYGGSSESFVYSMTPSCDAKGWIYASRSSSCVHQCRRHQGGGNSGLRHRRWIRSCAVCTEAPWQEVGPLKIKSLSLSRASGNGKHCIEVWAVTDAGELVCRSDVMPSNPAGSFWVHYPTPRRLHCAAAAPESNSTHLWAVCAEFGLLWQSELKLRGRHYDQLTWRCLGFSPTGAAWHRIAPVSARCLWGLDVNGRLWVHLTEQRTTSAEQRKAVEDERLAVDWIKVTSPRVSDISCSPDGKVWAVFSATNALALRTGISQKVPSGTGWLLAFEGIVASICIKGSYALP